MLADSLRAQSIMQETARKQELELGSIEMKAEAQLMSSSSRLGLQLLGWGYPDSWWSSQPQ